MFEIKYDIIKGMSKAPPKGELEQMNQIGLKSVEYSLKIIT